MTVRKKLISLTLLAIFFSLALAAETTGSIKIKVVRGKAEPANLKLMDGVSYISEDKSQRLTQVVIFLFNRKLSGEKGLKFRDYESKSAATVKLNFQGSSSAPDGLLSASLDFKERGYPASLYSGKAIAPGRQGYTLNSGKASLSVQGYSLKPGAQWDGHLLFTDSKDWGTFALQYDWDIDIKAPIK